MFVLQALSDESSRIVVYDDREKLCRHLTRVHTTGESQWYYIVDRGVQSKVGDNCWRWWSTEEKEFNIEDEHRTLDGARAFVQRVGSLLITRDRLFVITAVTRFSRG